jgi:outer membrane protein assembly factor BamB
MAGSRWTARPLVDVESGHTPHLTRTSLTDGRVQWRVPVEPDPAYVWLANDGRHLFWSWQRIISGPGGRSAWPTAQRVAAHDLADGRELWRLELAGDTAAVAVERGRVAAIVDGDLQIIDGPSGVVHARVALGWTDLGPGLHIDDGPGLVIAGGRIYAAHGGEILAFTLAAGEPLWTAAARLAELDVVAIAGDDLLVATAAGTVLALDGATGARRWDVELGFVPRWLHATAEAVVGWDAAGRVGGFALPRRRTGV